MTKRFALECLSAFAFSLVFLATQGITPFGASATHDVTLLGIKALSGDPILSHDFNVLAQKYYHINFNYLLLLLSRYVELPAVFMAGYFISLWLFYFAIRMICDHLFKDRRVFFLSLVLLLLWPSKSLESYRLWGNKCLDAVFVTHALVLFYFGFLLRKKWLPATLTACAGLYFHEQIMLAAFGSGLIFMAVYAKEFRIPNILKSIFIFLLFLIPVLIELYPVLFKSGASIASSYIAFVDFRAPHHVRFFADKFLFYAGIFAVAGTALFIYRRFYASTPDAPEKHQGVFVLCLAIFACSLIHYLDFYFLKSGIITKMHLIRISTFIHFFAVLFSAKAMIGLLSQKRLAANLAGILAFLILTFTLDPASRSYPWSWSYFVFFPAGVWLLDKKAGGFHQGRSPAIFLMATALIMLLLPPFVSAEKGRMSLRLPAFFREPLYHYDVRLAGHRLPWMDICLWAKNKTPPETLFVTPPGTRGFTALADRRMVAEFIAYPTVGEDAKNEWMERIRNLAAGRDIMNECEGRACESLLNRYYSALTPEQVYTIAQKYGATYLVTFLVPYPFELAYANSQYLVYDLGRISKEAMIRAQTLIRQIADQRLQ